MLHNWISGDNLQQYAIPNLHERTLLETDQAHAKQIQYSPVDFNFVTENTSYPTRAVINISAGINDTGDGVHAASQPALGVLLSTFAVITIIGNVLVVYAVLKERHLRSSTNYFMVSLAISDLIIGAVVMPFAISLQVTGQVWFYGHDWCDVWHSFDVLASTASILNLCVIALDRYWAILNPITYPTRMSTGKALVIIALVWICSSAISFPAILWWRAVTKEPVADNVCFFTEDPGYLIFSSIISFYAPVIIILFAYFRIFRAASEQIRSIRTGSKVMCNTFHGGGEKTTLRIHRGGGIRVSNAGNTSSNSRRNSNQIVTYARAPTCDSDTNSPSHAHHHSDEITELTPVHRTADMLSINSDDTPQRVSRTWRNFAISRKLSKIAKEQKAAKTLGIVIGVFFICWAPFFVTNVLFGICHIDCVLHADIIFPVFNWLGYINSGMNPIIYACSMRDFRRAFAKILCCMSPKRFKYVNKSSRYQMSFSTTTTTVSYTDNILMRSALRNGNA